MADLKFSKPFANFYTVNEKKILFRRHENRDQGFLHFVETRLIDVSTPVEMTGGADAAIEMTMHFAPFEIT